MATPNDSKKNPEPNRAGTDINKNVADVKPQYNDDGSEKSKEQIEAEEQERKDYEARMKYATTINGLDTYNEKFIDSEDDWKSVNRLIADGHAQLCAKQRGMETFNYIELTPEGERAVQAYNSKED